MTFAGLFLKIPQRALAKSQLEIRREPNGIRDEISRKREKRLVWGRRMINKKKRTSSASRRSCMWPLESRWAATSFVRP